VRRFNQLQHQPRGRLLRVHASERHRVCASVSGELKYVHVAMAAHLRAALPEGVAARRAASQVWRCAAKVGIGRCRVEANASDTNSRVGELN
jgi:hypothetical protein